MNASTSKMIFRMVRCHGKRLPGLWCYVAASLVLAYYAGSAVPLAKVTGMSLTEYILYVLTDHYYLIYVWFFFLLYWIVHVVQMNRRQEWIRYGSCRMKYNVDNLTAVFQLSLMILGNLVLVTLIGLAGVGVSGGFRAARLTEDISGNLTVLAGYAQIFLGPVPALVCVLLYWDLGCIFLYMMLYYAYHLGGRRAMIVELLFYIFSTMVGFITEIDESVLNLFFFNNYYILHHALLMVGSWAVGINVAVMVIAWIGMRGMAIWQRKTPT